MQLKIIMKIKINQLKLWNDYSTFKTIYSNYFYKLWNSISENSIDDNFNTFLIKKSQRIILFIP